MKDSPQKKSNDCDLEIDTSGLLCPHPLLKTKQALKTMPPGSILKVITTDPASIIDFKVFAQTCGYDLRYQQVKPSTYCFWLTPTMPKK